MRNLLEGRRVGSAFGPVSTVAYTPDSFGHPAQFPQLFAGFGLRAFVYWRGNPSALAELPPEYRWQAPDASSVVACHLGAGYFNAGNVARDPDAAASKIAHQSEKLALRTRQGRVLLMNGFDHAAPCAEAAGIARALEARTGWDVRRALVDDFVDGHRRRAARVSRRAGRRVRRAAASRCLVRAARPEAPQPRLRDAARAAGRAVRGAGARTRARGRAAEPARGVAGAACGTRPTTRSAAARSTACTRRWSRATTRARSSRARPTLRALERLSGHGVARATPSADDDRDRGVEPVAVPALRRRAPRARSLAVHAVGPLRSVLPPLAAAAAGGSGLPRGRSVRPASWPATRTDAS